jgi:hypothetical protein
MITFDVDPVEPSPGKLAVGALPEETLVRHLFGGKRGFKGGIEAGASNLGNLFDEYTENGYDDDVEAEEAVHPFVEAVHLAYGGHFPLVLSPDDVWLCIAQGFGIHVNQNAEALRERFVRHQGKAVIRVRRDDFVKGSPSNDWQGAFAEFSDRIADYIGKKRDLVVADFSTTGPIERAASEVVLMSAMQKYFDYRMSTMCGIPSITLLGTPQDWQSIRTRAAVLAEYDLGWWIDVLLPILDEFVGASNGRANRKFWQTIYKLDDSSGGPYITGWIRGLFPYVMEYDRNSNSSEDPQLVPVPNRRGFEAMTRDPVDAPLTTGSFPKGASKAPFIWEYLGNDIPMEFLGGFVGVSQDPETRAIRPAIGWAVRDPAGA